MSTKHLGTKKTKSKNRAEMRGVGRATTTTRSCHTTCTSRHQTNNREARGMGREEGERRAMRQAHQPLVIPPLASCPHLVAAWSIHVHGITLNVCGPEQTHAHPQQAYVEERRERHTRTCTCMCYDQTQHHTIPLDTRAYRFIPFHTIPYHTIPYHTIPYHNHTIPY